MSKHLAIIIEPFLVLLTHLIASDDVIYDFPVFFVTNFFFETQIYIIKKQNQFF